MSQLNSLELQHLRGLIGAQETTYQKMQAYARDAMDPQVKAYFTTAAQGASKTMTQLMGFLC